MSSSTPSKNKTAVRSQTGITHNQVNQLKPDVMQDLEEAQSCNFDRLLKYFLYLVLDEQSAERSSLNELQGKIEVLQERLDCHCDDDCEERQRTVTEREPEKGKGRGPVGAPSSAASTGREDQVDAPNAIEELDALKAQRDQQLDKIFENCLQAVLPICNEEHSPLRQHLADYCSVKAAEAERYAPYVSACNHALDRMKSLPNLPLRPPSSLDLCLHRSDPKIIQSRYPGSSESVERKPGVIGASSHLWIWYCNRQGIMQSDGIDFVQDLPRFLVLLLAFRRFTLEDWGVIEALNPTAVRAHTPDDHLQLPIRKTRKNPWDGPRARAEPITRVKFESIRVLESPKGHPTDLIINKDDYLSHKPHCLPGRATAVLGASAPDSNLPDLACKIYHPEVTRQNEGEMLDEIYKIVESKDLSMKKHLPDMLFHEDLPRCTTHRVRSMSGKAWKGHRTARLVVSKEAQPLTTLAGSQFVKSWLEVVKCHAFLWKHGVEHDDPSLRNIMYSVQDRCGVLADYDLSVLRPLHRVFGSDTTGTIPFMALALLEPEYWDGNLKREFYHELEAFIWILVFVFLRYQDGKARNNTLVERWITSDYNACREAKGSLIYFKRMNAAERQVQNDFRNEWPLASTLLRWALDAHNLRFQQLSEPEVVVSTDFAGVWKDFLAKLRFTAAKFPGLQYLENLMDTLGLEKLLVDDIPGV
ncbi:hypothetical protein LshimejAT787_1702380 [Lyophyllum shimeji]|uniref:Fungal-type protein kinase domain-containing protein n=1 Tax=Lyophyllum shimeji TaxID=47721 RepID=A0A9P3Q0Q5_LYOSH|nr:hypothetical protein LshimejAT787_1702380 [Lyophyllum shimeji]